MATGRPRAMSGTIPSMETTGDALKDNTIIIGASAFFPRAPPDRPSQPVASI